MYFINWVENHNGLLMLTANLILVSITAYYAWQSRKQANDTHKMLNEAYIQKRNTALNYIYLINGEMCSHQIMYVSYIYYKSNSGDYFDNLKINTWETIKSEVPKYYTSSLMEELVGYYYAVDSIAKGMYFPDHMLEVVIGQLITMHKYIRMIETEFKIKMRVQEYFEFKGTKIQVNKETGELIICK